MAGHPTRVRPAGAVGYPRPVPELPEVEPYRVAAEAALGRPIAAVDSPDAWYLKGGVTGPVLERVLVGRTFIAARRIGKLLLLDVDDGPTLGVRFGMTGTLVVDGAAGRRPAASRAGGHDRAWDRWSPGFADGGILVVHDPRRLGGVTLDPDLGRRSRRPHRHPARARPGLDGSATALKARLLDQSRWPASATSSPTRCCGGPGCPRPPRRFPDAGRGPPSPPPPEADPRPAHRAGRLASRRPVDERHPGGRCPRDGAELVRGVVGGRTTWWCPRHQR